MKNGDDRNAFYEMEKVLDLAIVAFSKVKKFEHKVKCKWLSIFCRLMILSYDKSEEKFRPLEKVPRETKKTMAELIFNDLTDVVAKFESIKIPIMKKMANDPKKMEQEALDGLLEATLPLIWHYVDIFKSPETWTNGKEHEKVLKYIPVCTHWRNLRRSNEWGQWAKIPIGEVESLHVWKYKPSYVGKYVDEPLICRLGKHTRSVTFLYVHIFFKSVL